MEQIISFSAHFEDPDTFKNLANGLSLLAEKNLEPARKHLGRVSAGLMGLCDGAHIEEIEIHEEEMIINISFILGGTVNPEDLSMAIGKESRLYYAEYFDDAEGGNLFYAYKNGLKISPSKAMNRFGGVAAEKKLGIVGERIRDRNRRNQDSSYALKRLIVSKGGVDAVIQKLEEGADTNQANGERSLLCEAIQNKKQDVALALIDFGANVHGGNSRESPLTWTVAWGCAKVFDRLLEEGADPNARDSFYGRPLHQSARERRHAYAKKLLLANARTDILDDRLLPIEQSVDEFTYCRDKEIKQIGKLLDLFLAAMLDRNEDLDVKKLVSRIKRRAKRDRLPEENAKFLIDKVNEYSGKFSDGK